MVTNARQHAAQLGDPAPPRHHGRVAIEGVRGGGQTHRGVHAGEGILSSNRQKDKKDKKAFTKL